jgi:hypothetical protein
MSRKHFRALADAIRLIPDAAARRQAAAAVASVCRAMNGRFDTARFLEAADAL